MVVSERPLSFEAETSFFVETAWIGDSAVIEVHGEVDVATAPELEDCLAKVLNRAPRCVVLELAGMGFIDCAGIRSIIGARNRLEGKGSCLILRHPQHSVRRVLELTHPDELRLVI